MTNKPHDNLDLPKRMDLIQKRIGSLAELDSVLAEVELREAALELSKLVDQPAPWGEATHDGGKTLAQILRLAAFWCGQFPEERELANEMVEFVEINLCVLHDAVESEETSGVEAFIRFAQDQWSEDLQLIESEQAADPWKADDDGDSDSLSNDDASDASSSDIAMMLSAITDSPASVIEDQPDPNPTQSSGCEKPKPKSDSKPKPQPATHTSDDAAKQELMEDRELLEAYLDDALRCLSSMEQSALATENAPADKEPTEQFCRELHTLKGASATVGLANLASYIHDVETSLEETDFANADFLFEAVDHIRAEIHSLEPHETNQEDPGDLTANDTASNSGFNHFASNDDSSIRIRAAKLDRLMDMLAELVVLRNRRESHSSDFNVFNEELARCATRLSISDDGFEPTHSFEGESNFSEVAKDIEAVAQGLRDLQKPVSQDNGAISRFIRDFRQELMQLRRVPVSGLFQRLQRAARDAAKSEGKQVQIELLGEHAGLEQEIQERLFESLLHVVRNSVSHGIETPEKRTMSGKPAAGQVTLEACSNAQLLIIEVRDDGNGLDFAAVQKRAIEKGLISANQRPSNDELASLIFHPGFSTREQASQISGRGVGMDIVAKTIEQLHGRIEVDSEAGQGTTIRLLIPLRTGIEHVMVFRSNGQLFALPMQSVTAVKTSSESLGQITKVSLWSALSNQQHEAQSEDILVLRTAHELRQRQDGSPTSRPTQLGLAVDELVGPEEVVVRGLPNLLKQHPLFCGVTLSGSGEKVLLLDSERIIEFCHSYQNTDQQLDEEVAEQSTDKLRALVVDDSLTARKMLSKQLQKQNFSTVEVGDGIEAIERLNRQKFDLVITDLDMPNLGGLELLSDIQSGQYCDAPVVVVSSRDKKKFRTKAMDLGAVDYIKKPLSKDSIESLLESLEMLPEPLEIR